MLIFTYDNQNIRLGRKWKRMEMGFISIIVMAAVFGIVLVDLMQQKQQKQPRVESKGKVNLKILVPQSSE